MALWNDGNGNIYSNSGGGVPFDATQQELEDCCCAVESACNACDPPISTTLYATLPSDLTGDFAPYAGNKYELNWVKDHATGDCWWESSSGEVTLTYSGGFWDLNLHVGGDSTCFISWAPNFGDCDPTGTYPFNVCDDSTCSETSCGTFGDASVSDQP